MFGFLLSEEKKMRRHASNWLEVADRVYKFRRDLLSDAQNQQLIAASGEVKTRLSERADASKLKMAIEKLEGVLRDTGGRLYPVSSLVENVEFFLVAAIVILGLRAYFVQPFKIPTNSMWPSYYGMTHESFKDGKEPGPLARTARLLAYGATHYSVTAPASGEVLIPIYNNFTPAYTQKPGKTFYVFPSMKREMVFSVGGKLARLEMPADFDFDRVLDDAFGGGKDFRSSIEERVARSGRNPESSVFTVTSGGRRYEQRVYWVPLGKTVKAGEPIVSFDILTGDLLFVDRITYNFFPPKVGQGFVFKTAGIPALSSEEGDKYYIKRLVGLPGDKLEIRAPELFRNDKPIEGSPAFSANANRAGTYPGYTAEGLLAPGLVAEVPEDSYMALGDNSPRSKDSRYWGFVPDKDVVGKPLLIYYPLTPRWGIPK